MGNIVGWRSASRYSNYPLSGFSSGRSVSGWELPGGTLVDAQIRVNHGATGAALSWLNFAGGTLTGEIVSDGAILGTFSFAPGELNNGVAQIITPGGWNCGFIVAGATAENELAAMPGSQVDFEPGAADFEVSTIFTYPEATVRSILVEETPVAGRVVLVEGPGVRITRESAVQLRFDAVGYTGDLDACDRAGDGPALKTINSGVPDEYGDFRIEPGQYAAPSGTDALRQILRIVPGINSLTFSLAR